MPVATLLEIEAVIWTTIVPQLARRRKRLGMSYGVNSTAQTTTCKHHIRRNCFLSTNKEEGWRTLAN